MGRQRDTLPLDPAWAAFAQRHAGHPFLQEDPLYALSDRVIDAIKNEFAESAVPGFFTRDQEAFERDLTQTTRHGFFLGRPIDSGCVWLGEGEGGQAGTTRPSAHPDSLTVGEFLEHLRSLPRPRQQAALDQLGHFLLGQEPQMTTNEAMRTIEEFLRTVENSGPRQTAQRRRGERPDAEDLLRRRQEAYAGWLVLNPTYRTEVNVLRQHCEGWVVDETRFPCLGEYGAYPATLPGGESREGQASPGSVEGRDARPAPPGESRQGHPGRFLDFYQRWGLDRFLTWELPQPMGIVRCEVSELAGQAPPLDGVALLIPWPLLRGEQVDFQESLGRLREERGPAHLVEWLTSEQKGEGGRAQITYQGLFFLYRVYELVLFRRYKQACKGRLAFLDASIASVLGYTEEIVRKQRQRLQAALRCAP